MWRDEFERFLVAIAGGLVDGDLRDSERSRFQNELGFNDYLVMSIPYGARPD